MTKWVKKKKNQWPQKCCSYVISHEIISVKEKGFLSDLDPSIRSLSLYPLSTIKVFYFYFDFLIRLDFFAMLFFPNIRGFFPVNLNWGIQKLNFFSFRQKFFWYGNYDIKYPFCGIQFEHNRLLIYLRLSFVT
jgi:hypothetical protein